MSRLFRSLLFVPANNSRFLEKAKTISADIVCFDLEDSVPEAEKEQARNLVKDALKVRSEYAADVYVRTNSPVSGKIAQDLNYVMQKGLDGIVIPKVNNIKELDMVCKIISSIEKKRKLEPPSIIPSIESAQGVVNAYGIASANKRIVALIFGIFDLLNDMGIEYTKDAQGAMYARSKIPVDATAAGVLAIDAIWQDLKDVEGLRRDCMVGRSLGYCGKSLIHPDQITHTHQLFAPTKSELEWAKKVIDVYERAAKNKKGATLVDGKMVDEVHYKRAKALLDLAN